MKKHLLYISAVALGLFSCSENYLDTTPESSTATATILESTDNAELIINGLCKAMTQQYGAFSQGYNGEGAIKTWFGSYPGNDTQKSNLTGWTNTINGNYHEMPTDARDIYPWYYYYKMISNANSLILNIDAASGTEQDKAYLKAQALVFRAYSFFMLSQLYAHRWSDEQGETPAIVLRLDQSTGDQPLSTLKETYAQVYKDLDDAIALFQLSGMDRKADEWYKPNLNVAYAVYARAALTREDWANASKYAKLAREGYPLMSNSDYMDGGYHTPNSEWIWAVYEAEDQTLYFWGFYAYQGSNGDTSVDRSYPLAISRDLIEQIPETDIRRGHFLIPETAAEFKEAFASNGNPRSCTSTFGKKARSMFGDKVLAKSQIYPYMQVKFTAAFQVGGGSFPLFRTAEMYYTEAEAEYHLNNAAKAQQLIYEANKDRDPSYTQSTKTGQDLLDEIRLYRRFDLWGEGYDWYDYKRWGLPISRRHYKDGGSWHTNFAITYGPEDRNAWTWVIPERETLYNGAVN